MYEMVIIMDSKTRVKVTESTITIKGYLYFKTDMPIDFPEPKKDRSQNARKLHDIGKVKALYRAGWSTKAIAEEMKVTQRTIQKALKAEKEAAAADGP